jgi:hypothetical protein
VRKLLHLFGANLESGFPFTVDLPAGRPPADLAFDLEPGLGAPELAPGRPAPIYSSPWREEGGESVCHLFRLADRDLFSFSKVVEFHLGPRRISARLLHPDYEYLVEFRLLGPILSFWLERQGIPTLHASAVEVKGHAGVFLSASGGGKTGLAAAMMQAGHALLTDDILPVEETGGAFLGRPGYPQMKMWPDEAAHFFPGWEHLPRVHPQITKRRVTVGEGHWGAFHDSPLPLAALYLPERREGGPIEISPLSRSQAVIELVRHSFSPHLVQAVGLQPSRLDFFARLVRQVPVRRLAYPSGFERLPEVVEAVRRDLRSA